MAVASLVLGILSLCGFWIPFGNGVLLILAIVGVILGAMARKNPAQQGMATAGLVLSIIGLVLSGIGFVSCTLLGACAACSAGTAGIAGL